MTRADEYNRRELEAGRIEYEHLDALLTMTYPDSCTSVSMLVEDFQLGRGLAPDGMLGPATRAALVAPVEIEEPLVGLSPLSVVDHLLERYLPELPRLVRALMHPSWYLNSYPRGPMDDPEGVVWHYSVTEGGTARRMAERRARKRGDGEKKTAWHVSIEKDGTIFQMAPFDVPLPHAGHAWGNQKAIGIELISEDGSTFPPAQVAAAARVLRALVRRYNIPRSKAMVPHSDLNPNRTDPGPVWMKHHAHRVLQYAYGDPAM
jgi:hypothetical protein